MSPKKPVLSLHYICVKFLSYQLIQLLSDDESDNFKQLSEYLQDVTYEVLQDLLYEILSSVNLDAGTRSSCLQLLLREDVTHLETGMFPNSYYRSILEVISEKGKGIKHLNLKGVWVRDYPTELLNVVNSLKKLKSLLIPHMSNDSVLEAINRCEHLQVLDISGEAYFTAEGVLNLKSETLKTLDIGNFGKRHVCLEENSGPELVARIIENLPNLQSLKTYSFTGSALLTLHRKDRSYKTKLTYLHDTYTTPEIMKAIIELCPDLENVHIDSGENDVINMLAELKKLTCLKLTRPKCEELINYLRLSGTGLQVLKLNHNKNSSLDVREICLSAPNLRTLECYHMKLSFSQPDVYFMVLQSVELLYCDMTDSLLKLVLSNSPLLKRIVVGCDVNMTDGDVFRLCADCDFTCLEELWISYAKGLTVTSLELLMSHCSNLKVVGVLNGWDINVEEVEFLRYMITVTNTDLTILPWDSSSYDNW